MSALRSFSLVICLFALCFLADANEWQDEDGRFALLGEVVINEFCPFPSAANSGGYVELYSSNVMMSLELSGFILQVISTNGIQGPSFSIPAGTFIQPLGFLTLSLPASSASRFFTGAVGGRLLLLGPAGEIDDCHEYQLDSATFPVFDKSLEDLYFARIPDGALWFGEMLPVNSLGTSNLPMLDAARLLYAKQHANVSSSATETTTSSSWKSGTFEIHMFDMGQADAMLIIFPSGYTVLVDAGEKDSFNSYKNALSLSAKVQQIIGKKSIDVGVISHLHLDHLGYVLYGGFYGLVEREGFTFGKIIDRNAGVWVDSNKDGVCDENTEIVWKNAGTMSGTSRKWICYATDPSTKIGKVRQVGELCSTSQIEPPDNNAFVKIVTIDAIGATLKDGKTKLNQDLSGLSMPPSENDYSIGLLIGYGNFRMATFGDLDGEYASSSYGYTYNDVEGAIAHRVGQVDVYRANHHGSAHSSSTGLVNVMQPQATLFSCGVGNSYGHPDQQVLNRVAAYGKLFLTSDCNTARTYPNGTVRANGNVVIRSTDVGTTFVIFDDASQQKSTFTSTVKSDMPPCP